MDNVFCVGTESTLFDCSHNGFDNHNCQHYEDAGVVCSSEYTDQFTDHSILTRLLSNLPTECYCTIQIQLVVLISTLTSDWSAVTTVPKVA